MPQYRIVLSPQAERDLEEICEYTRLSWGDKRTDIYMRKVEEAFFKLLDNPELGRERSAVKAGYRSMVIEKHVLFYRLEGEEIRILGIPHGRMDIYNYFAG